MKTCKECKTKLADNDYFGLCSDCREMVPCKSCGEDVRYEGGYGFCTLCIKKFRTGQDDKRGHIKKQTLVSTRNDDEGTIVATFKTKRSIFLFFALLADFLTRGKKIDLPGGCSEVPPEGTTESLKAGKIKWYIVWGKRRTVLIMDMPKKEYEKVWDWLKERIEFMK